MSKARTLPSVDVTTAELPERAAHEATPPVMSLLHFGSPLARSNAAMKPLAPLKRLTSMLMVPPQTITVLPSTDGPPHGFIFKAARQSVLPVLASRQKRARSPSCCLSR